jgi:hypothetical protein
MQFYVIYKIGNQQEKVDPIQQHRAIFTGDTMGANGG